jgi:hypothetical protein
MLDSMKIIAELLRVFSFSLLGITLCVVAYALLQVFLQGLTGHRKARNRSDGATEQNEDQERNTPIPWDTFQASPHASTGFTRHAKQ